MLRSFAASGPFTGLRIRLRSLRSRRVIGFGRPGSPEVQFHPLFGGEFLQPLGSVRAVFFQASAYHAESGGGNLGPEVING